MQQVYSNMSLLSILDQLKPNGISQSYQLDQSISLLRVVGCVFSANQNHGRYSPNAEKVTHI